jgi:hypothetical protein
MTTKDRNQFSDTTAATDENSSSNPAFVNAQLLIVRYLFGEGERALASKSRYSPGLAVSLFQDAAELLLACVAHALDARVTVQTRFMDYWESIEKARLNQDKKQVPSKAAIARLNAMRVAFKHRGQLPMIEDAETARIDTEVFLRQVTSRFLGLEFDEVALTDLIVSDVTRQHIKNAERCLAQGDYVEGFNECSLAERSLQRGLPADLQEVDVRGLERAVESLELGRSTRAAAQIVRHLAEHLSVHRNAIRSLISEREIGKFRRFRMLAPTATQYMSGRIEFNWRRKLPKEQEQVVSELRYCIDYVVDQALRQQYRA